MGHGLSRGFRAAAVSLLAVAVVAWARRRRPVSGEASPAEATEAAPARDAIPSRPSRPPPRPKRLAEVFICLDFEWTCDDGERRRVHSDNVEILEFSYVIYDVAAERVVREGQHYCKNQRTPITKFCSELTGITDDTVASAGSLKDALQALQEDLNVEELRGRTCCAVAHGSADLELILPMHCKALGLEVPDVLRSYADLRLAAQRHVQSQGQGVRASSLKEICDALGVEMMGSEHCGLDDSRMVLLALQQLLKSKTNLCPVNFYAELEAFLRGTKKDTNLAVDGLPFNLLEEEMRTWLAEHLGQVAAGKITLWVVLAVDGRASGRAVLGFESWEAAKAALLLFAGGKLMKVPALEGRRYSERLVLVRPVRPDEALRRAESLAEPGELPALAPFPTALNQLFGGPKYCFAFQKGQCQRGESCRYLHEKAPAGAKPKPCFDFRLGNCARGTRCPYAHDAPRARSG